MRSLNPFRILVLAAFVSATSWGVTLAEPTQEETASDQQQSDDSTVSFTNDDLERMFGASKAPEKSVPEATAAREGAPSGDPLQALQNEQDKLASQQSQIAAAQARVAEAEARVKVLEQRSAQIANPLLPRPQLSPEEAEAWKGMSGVQRLAQNQAEIDEAKKAAENAKKDLETAQDGGQ